MKFCRLFFSSPRRVILPLASLLLITSALAQQADNKVPDAAPSAQAPEPGPGAERATTDANKPGPEKPPTTTRFIPSEKIHADDAVSFPVDI